VDTAKIDTVVESAPMPKAADKLFADFFFDFISKKKVQMARIQFPLKSVNGSQVKMIQRGAWKMERFYQNQEYYTQIFDDARQMAHVAKAKADTVIVEKIHLGNGVVEQYLFNHPEGKWMLAELRTGGLAESSNAGFLTFLQKFFADKHFQMSHVANPLNYYGPDPEDDESPKNVRRKIPAASWSDFIPEVPKGQIYNILYGQKYGEGKHYPSMTTALIRGLDNAYPITTQHWYNAQHKGITGRWNDDDFEEFKKVIDDDFENIYQNCKKYEKIIFPIGGIFNSKISQINKVRTPKLYSYLMEKCKTLLSI
jgi:hypothetical protein